MQDKKRVFIYNGIKGSDSRIRDYMDPLPEVEMIPHDIDGLHILQLKVNAGHYTPYYYVGDGQRIAFVRVGDESMPATAEQMVRLVLKGSNYSMGYEPKNQQDKQYQDGIKPGLSWGQVGTKIGLGWDEVEKLFIALQVVRPLSTLET